MTKEQAEQVIEELAAAMESGLLHPQHIPIETREHLCRLLEKAAARRTTVVNVRDGATPYSLELTPADITAIAFVGHRYEWSDALRGLEAGVNRLTEAEAWELRDAFERDTEGGHSHFPMLDPRSELYEKLLTFIQRIV